MRYRIYFSLILTCALPSVAAAQEIADGSPASEPETAIVARVNDPASAVSFEMPQALLERITAESHGGSADDGREAESEEAESERQARTKGTKSVGFRVQVYSDNNARTAKGTARQRERAISGAFPAFSTYVTYASPYWRLRVGDFRSQYDAEKAAAEIKRAFPSFAREVRVVRDRVNLR